MKQYILEILIQKRRLVTVIFALLALNSALLLFYTFQQLPQLVELQSSWSEMRRKGSAMGKQDAASLYKQAASDLIKLNEYIPEKREFARVLGELYDSASGSAVQITNLSYKPEQKKDEPLFSYQLSVTVDGSYAAVKSFLADLQNKSELIVVDDVAFSSREAMDENVVMNLKLTLYLRGGV